MAFDTKKHLIKVQGNREYLPVAARLVWFREEHPDWAIVTHPIEINMEKQYAIFACTIVDADGKTMATATKMENVRGFGDWLEKAETGSVGRALAYCGYGTQFAPDLDEDTPAFGGNGGVASSGNGRGFVRDNQNNYGSSNRGGGGSSIANGASTANGADAANHCSVEGCPNTLTAGQASTSMRKFGQALCLAHQKTAVPLAVAAATSHTNGDGS